MVTTLDASNIDAHTDAPGVAFINWRSPRHADSLLFDRMFEQASQMHRDVRFGSVDTKKERGIAREFEVSQTPSLMAYRDGILVFRGSGPLPEPVLEGLIQAVFTLNMEEVRKGIDGQGARLVLRLRPDEESTLEIVEENEEPPAGQAPRGGRRKQ
jgi:thioredoxin 1